MWFCCGVTDRGGPSYSPPLAGGAPTPFRRPPLWLLIARPSSLPSIQGSGGQSHPQSVHMGAAPAPRSGVINKEYMITAYMRPHSCLCSCCFPCLGTLFSDHRTLPSRPAARPPPLGRPPLPTLIMSLLTLIPSPSDFISNPLWACSLQLGLALPVKRLESAKASGTPGWLWLEGPSESRRCDPTLHGWGGGHPGRAKDCPLWGSKFIGGRHRAGTGSSCSLWLTWLACLP